MTRRGEHTGGAGTDPAATAPLDGALAEAVRRTGASGGAVYLWERTGRRGLGPAVLCAIPVEVARPWQRIPVDGHTPVADAVREDRLVWVGSQEDLAHAYPRVAVPLPYRFSLAAAPLPGRGGRRGAVLLLWPARHPADATRRELDHLTAEAHRLARILDGAGAEAMAVVPEQPRVVPAAPLRPYDGPGPNPGPVRGGPGTGPGPAADWAERLPEGALALDLEGRITFLDGTAEELLGRSAAQLVGTRPWQSLPWLDVPLVEDRYRTAVISREPVEVTTRKPPDGRLRFELYPDASGISVRITDPAAAPPEPGAPASTRPRPGPVKPGVDAGRVYQLLHLSAALTETIAVRDVVDLVAHQILPAFGADAVVLSAADSGRLKITGHHGYDPAVIDRLDALPLDTELTPAGRVLATGAPAFFGSPREMADAYPRAPWLSGKQAWAFLPLMISARPVGCCILSYELPHAFTADERAVLTAPAGLIAQALDRARLYDTANDLAHAGGAHGGAQLPHECGRGDVVTLYVSDDGGDGGGVQDDDVVEVAPYLHPVAGRQVACGDLESGHAGQAVRKECLLEAGGGGLLHQTVRVEGDQRARGQFEAGDRAGGVDTDAEQRGRVDAERGTEALASVLAEPAGIGLDELVDTILDSSGPGFHTTDDIALLLLRTEPEQADGRRRR